MNRLYYKDKHSETPQTDSRFEAAIAEFKPTLRQVYLEGETKSFKTTVVRLQFQWMTRGKATIVYAKDTDGTIVHTAYVVPKCRKFPFLGQDDYEIGPCFTRPSHRGQGIYPRVLTYICRRFGCEATAFYMIVDSENTASVRGIEKAGFVPCGAVKKSRILKCYHREH